MAVLAVVLVSVLFVAAFATLMGGLGWLVLNPEERRQPWQSLFQEAPHRGFWALWSRVLPVAWKVAAASAGLLVLLLATAAIST